MEAGYITLTFKIDSEDNLFVSTCPELGIASQGDTIDEALANIKDAAVTLLNELDEFNEVEDFLKSRRVIVHAGDLPAPESTETVEVRSGEIVSVFQALLGSQVVFAK